MMDETVICIKCQRRIPANYPVCSHCNARQRPIEGGHTDNTVDRSVSNDITVQESVPQTRFLSLGMVSGTRLEVLAVQLYDERILEKATRLRMEGSSKLQRVRTGLGFIGDLGFVLAAGAVLGMIENSLSDQTAREGWRLIGSADESLMIARQNGEYFAINEIHKIDLAMPGYWAAFRNGVRYVYNQDAMMTVRLRDDSVVYIAWDKVEAYSVIVWEAGLI